MQNSDIASLVLATVGILLNIRNYGGESSRLTVRVLRAPSWVLLPIIVVVLVRKTELFLLMAAFASMILWNYEKNNDIGAYAAKTKNYEPRAVLSAIFNGLISVLKIWPILVVFMMLTQWILPDYPQQDDVRSLKIEGGPLFYEMFWKAGLVAPIVEELIFRGLLYPMLKKYIGVFWGCVTSSLLFSFIHDNVLSFALLFLISAYLTFLYERNNNLLVPIACHAFFNLIVLTLILIDGL
jgi:membrane protease YdiL (CAAX protease family)